VATRSIADQGAADLTRRRDPPPSDFPPWQVTSLKQVICGGAVGQTGLTRDRARAPNWADRRFWWFRRAWRRPSSLGSPAAVLGRACFHSRPSLASGSHITN